MEFTINNYIDELKCSINGYLKTFTSITLTHKVSDIIRIIEALYPFIIINNSTIATKCYLVPKTFNNLDVIKKAKNIFVDIDYNKKYITFPILYIDKLGYDLLNYKYEENKQFFSISNKIFILDIITDLVNRSYIFFDKHSSPTIKKLLNNNILINNSIDIINMLLDEDSTCDKTMEKIHKIFQYIDQNINENILVIEYNECEGYRSLIMISILLYVKNIISCQDYYKVRRWFQIEKHKMANNNKNKYNEKTHKSINIENRIFLDCCMAFFAMEDTYNMIFNKKYYDLTVWT